MAVTFGFYDSLNGDRKYNALQMSSIFDGIINDGVYQSIGDRFAVKANGGLQITVGTGRAWFNHTWTLNDSVLILDATQADLVLDRIDEVVLNVDTNDARRINFISIVNGTPSSSPARPTLSKSNGLYQYSLGYIKRKAGSTAITQADITNTVGLNATPFVTGPLKVLSIDQFVDQWQAQWTQWFDDEKAANGVEFSTWLSSQKSTFDAWYAGLKTTLTGDVAANLAVQLAAIKAQMDTLTNERAIYQGLEDSQNNPVLDSTGVQINGRIVYGLVTDPDLSSATAGSGIYEDPNNAGLYIMI